MTAPIPPESEYAAWLRTVGIDGPSDCDLYGAGMTRAEFEADD